MPYIDLKYKPADDLVCEFYLEPSKGISMRKAAEQVAAESSIGTWTRVHTDKPYMHKLAARVFSMKGKRVKVAYPPGLFEPGNIPQILSSIAGNIFGMKSVRNPLRYSYAVWFPSIVEGILSMDLMSSLAKPVFINFGLSLCNWSKKISRKTNPVSPSLRLMASSWLIYSHPSLTRIFRPPESENSA